MDLGQLCETIKTMSKQINYLESVLLNLEKRVVSLGTSCHTAFLQIREACEVLREDLGEASGILTEDTWL